MFMHVPVDDRLSLANRFQLPLHPALLSGAGRLAGRHVMRKKILAIGKNLLTPL